MAGALCKEGDSAGCEVEEDKMIFLLKLAYEAWVYAKYKWKSLEAFREWYDLLYAFKNSLRILCGILCLLKNKSRNADNEKS